MFFWFLFLFRCQQFSSEKKLTLSSQVKAVSGKLSGERLGGLSCADARGAIVAITTSKVAIVVVLMVVGEMLGAMWRCRLEARGAIRAANRQRTERKSQ